ncbi:hypothetical protein JTE90_003640 [Oedothorax gibbosus]|uniref:Metallo-beta-lactamase domain-containing protein n=1 Tax=Oedothorax gibbosus TaxID=931172 RepID=A0AAV6U5H5_9ARAC|nr:hypothetical protein JTE90_003640 [Oedothorax gibbosus]
MSTFDGVIKEYPLISIDNFLEKSSNFQSTVFFLSHCHEDHMRGLAKDKFFDLLVSRGFSRLYVSDVSEHLLKNDEKYCHLSKYLCSRIVVTLLTAGHCPGSVMFLLEGENGRVLYTGDFRIPIGGSARMPDLHDKNGRLKPIDSLYIDTTFCTEDYLYIPTREECLKEILKIVENWLSKGPDHIVRFVCPAKYAYEFVFVEIFKQLGEKAHVMIYNMQLSIIKYTESQLLISYQFIETTFLSH